MEKNITEIEEIDENYFETHDETFKPMNDVGYNDKRLKPATLYDLIVEIVNNYVQYGKSFANIFTNGNKITICNDLPKDFFKKICKDPELADITEHDSEIYLYLKDRMTTFADEGKESQRTSNFCEGLVLSCLVPAKLTVCGRYFIENRQGEGTSFYQYIKKASHVIKKKDGKRVAIPITKIPISKKLYWQWEFESSEMVKIFESIMKKSYLIRSDLTITINGNIIQTPRLFDLSRFQQENRNGTLYKKINIVENDDEERVNIYWLLPDTQKNPRGYRLIDNTQLNNKGVSGTIVLTNVDQFANVKRKELDSYVYDEIDSEIRVLTESHKNEFEIKNLIKNHYNEIKESQMNFVCENLKIPQNKYLSVFYQSGDSKQTRLEQATHFVIALKDVLNACAISYGNVKLFQHNSIASLKSNPKSFQSICQALGVKMFEIFGETLIGNIFQAGEFMGVVRVKDVDKKIYFIDNTREIMKLRNLSASKMVLYPINVYFEYLIHPQLLQKLTDQDYLEQSIKKDENYILPNMGIEELQKFGVGNDLVKRLNEMTIQNLEKQKKEAEELKKKLEAEEKKLEESRQQIKGIKPESAGGAININTFTNNGIKSNSTSSTQVQSNSTQPQSNITKEEKIIPIFTKEIMNKPSNSVSQGVLQPSSGRSSLSLPLPNGQKVNPTPTQPISVPTKIMKERNVVSTEKVVKFEGKVFRLKFKSYERGNVVGEYPIFEINNKLIIKDTYTKYEAWKNTLSIILQEAIKRKVLPDKIIIPVLYHETESDLDGNEDELTEAFYVDSYIGLNTEYWIGGNRMTIALDLIRLACHELAHIKYSPHGDKHQKLFERLMRIVVQETIEVDGKQTPIFQAIRDII